MWPSGSCPEIPETSQQNDDYLPPEKKAKEAPDSLNEALECCKNHELGIEEASLIYGIPKRTLRAKLKDSNFSVIDEKYRVFVLSVYPPEAESDLVEYLQNCITSQITLTTVEVRRLGYELVCEKYNVSSLPKEKNCILGQRWYKRFIEKYPHLDIRHQMMRVNQDKSTDFYNTLQVLVNKYGIDPSQIFSVDGVELKFRASCVDDLKIFHKRRTIYTDAKAICCASPGGVFIPPVFLKLQNNCSLEPNESSTEEETSDYQSNLSKSHLSTVCDKLNEMCNFNIRNRPPSEDLANIEKQIKMHLNKSHQPMSEENEEELREKLYEQFKELKNKIISKYESALNEVTPEIFHNWFVDFLDYVKPNPQKKVLLLLSDQNYVKSFKILELGKKNGVIFLVLPPHSNHKIYPLDGFAMSLNRNLSTCARRWLGKNPDFKVQQVPLHLLFMEAYRETVNPVIAKNGFLFSGIWPINRNIFESSELGGQSVLLQNNSQSAVTGGFLISSGNAKSPTNALLPGIIKEGDIGKLCRVCMKEKMYMKPLFESNPAPVPNYHGKKISELIKAPVSPADGLPKSLCQYCLVQLMDTIKVKGLAVDSHKKQLKLREALDRIYFEGDDSEKQALQSLLQADMPSKIINSILSKTFDMNSMCRICMGEKPLMTSIFFRPQDGSVFCVDTCNKITEVTQCEVHIHDGLSSSICPFCRASINKAAEFIQKLSSSDKVLRDIVSQFRAKT